MAGWRGADGIAWDGCGRPVVPGRVNGSGANIAFGQRPEPCSEIDGGRSILPARLKGRTFSIARIFDGVRDGIQKNEDYFIKNVQWVMMPGDNRVGVNYKLLILLIKFQDTNNISHIINGIFHGIGAACE